MDDEGVNESIRHEEPPQTDMNKSMDVKQSKQPNLSDDLFDIFNNQNASMANENLNNFSLFNFASNEMNNTNNTQDLNLPKSIFQDVDKYPTTEISSCYNQNDLIICSQFQRSNGQINLGLHFSKGVSSCKIKINKNSFGIICQSDARIEGNIAFFSMANNQSNTSGRPPSNPFEIEAELTYNEQQLNIQIKMDILVLFVENAKIVGNPFVQFFNQNKDQSFNNGNYSYPKYNNEDQVKTLLENNNIFFVARQNKANPPASFYSANILGSMIFLVESFLSNGVINIKIIANNKDVIPLIKNAIDSILN